MDPLQLNPPALHGETIAGQAAKVRRELLVLAGNVQERTLDFAEKLYEAQTGGYYLQWGFESVADYAGIELGIKPRKAQYLCRIVKVCREVGVKREDYEPAGVSKLRTITSLNPKDFFYNREAQTNEPLVEHIVRLIAEAPDMDGEEVEQEVKRLKGMTGENSLVVRSFSVSQSCWTNVIKRAFELARRKLGSAGTDDEGKAKEYSDGTCIEIICQEFLNDPSNYMEEANEDEKQIEIPEEKNLESSEGV